MHCFKPHNFTLTLCYMQPHCAKEQKLMQHLFEKGGCRKEIRFQASKEYDCYLMAQIRLPKMLCCSATTHPCFEYANMVSHKTCKIYCLENYLTSAVSNQEYKINASISRNMMVKVLIPSLWPQGKSLLIRASSLPV